MKRYDWEWRSVKRDNYGQSVRRIVIFDRQQGIGVNMAECADDAVAQKIVDALNA